MCKLLLFAGDQLLPASAAAPVTDAAVPEGHKGLHSFLYGDGDAEHTSQKYEFRQVGGPPEGGGGREINSKHWSVPDAESTQRHQ